MRNAHRIGRSVIPMGRVSAGFTLVELVVTLSIVGILVTIAAPSFRDIMISNRIETQSAALAADFTFARTEAVRRVAPVVVCPTDVAAAGCAGSSWNARRLVFVDMEGKPLTLDAADILLRLGEAPSSQDTLTASPQFKDLRFLPNGTASTAVTFQACHPGFRGHLFTLRRLGSVSATQPTAGAC